MGRVWVDDISATATASECPYCAGMVCACDLFGTAIGAFVDTPGDHGSPVRIGVGVVIFAVEHGMI